MLNALIRLSLQSRAAVLAGAALLLVLGFQAARELPVEVLPDLTKPTVTLLTECPGLAPEEVETLVTARLEAALQGVAGLDRLRSSSDVSLSLIFAEFAWGTDIYRARQLVQERFQAALPNLPRGVQPALTPVSSLMGEILLVGLSSSDKTIAPRDLRSLAEITVSRRLQAIPGVAEVLAIGGGVKQVHVLPDPHRMAAYGVTFAELEEAVSRTAGNATSGYLNTATREIMVRNLGSTTDLQEIGRTVVKTMGDRPLLLNELARVETGVQPMRGDASVNGIPGVILSIDKAPGFDTLALTANIERSLTELQPALPAGVKMEVLFRQGDFIGHAIANLKEAIRDGAIMVAIVLFLFLLNFRTTAITLTAIPLSFAVTLLVFRGFEVSLNSMTLGGLAVAIGMVVDDAIVDVENVWRRLRENAQSGAPKPALQVIASASSEVRSSILYATVLIILVFLPLLALEGIEGRLFTPIATATIISMAASFVVSLTIIPVLCSLLLRPSAAAEQRESFLARAMKTLVRQTFLRAAFAQPHLVLAFTGLLIAGALALYPVLGKEFLPSFNEGSATISMASAPGTSLTQTNEVGEVGARLLLAIPEVKSVGRRAGRAEKDDHVMPVSVNEFDVEFRAGGRSREEVFRAIRQQLGSIPGVFINLGQPIGHRLSHMLSGVSAKIAVKVFGPDLEQLRATGEQVAKVARGIPGLTDVNLEPQVSIPQLRIEVNRERAAAYGVQPQALNEQISTLVGGKVLAELPDGARSMDLLLRLPEHLRDSPSKLADLPVEAGSGARLPLRLLADVREASGPNVINRENGMRRIAVGCNTTERDLGTIVARLQAEIGKNVKLPEGCFISYEGEFRAQQVAARRIAWFSLLVLFVMLLLLVGYFRSVSLALQVLLSIPLALVGGLVFTWWLIGNISIATLVGFIAVGGIATRNGIMMLSHYLHLMRHEGETFSREMITRGTLERLVPVLMTALSAGIAMVPLVLAAGQPGKEILHPVAVVILGGLISSTLLELLVRPAAFHLFGRRAAARALAHDPSAAQ